MAKNSKKLQVVTHRRDFIIGTSTGLLAATMPLTLAQNSKDSSQVISSKANEKTGSSRSHAVAIVWKEEIEQGTVEIIYGAIGSISKPSSSEESRKNLKAFHLKANERRLEMQLDGVRTEIGAFATRVTVRFRKKKSESNAQSDGFTFLLRDVSADAPIIIDGLNVAVIPMSDQRGFDQIALELKAKKWRSDREKIESEPEETYENACLATKNMPSPIWLGVGRDMRIFRVMYNEQMTTWGTVEPMVYQGNINYPDAPVIYSFVVGRGANCAPKITRRLDDGVLPILRSVQHDGDIEYHLTVFASLEKEPLSEENVRGTNWLAAFAHTRNQAITEEEKAKYQELIKSEVTEREQELICWIHIEAVNTGNVPRYAYFRVDYQPSSGYAYDKSGNVTGLNQLDGRPMPQREVSVLVKPKEKHTLDLVYPHRPVSKARAKAIAKQSYESHYQACRKFWQAKLDRGAQISLPEKAIEERVRAGLLHLDIVTQGLSKEGPLLANVGVYPPIGSESAPIIQFYDSLGYHDLAERSIQLFLDRQRDDGFIQTFHGYQLETGPVLWTIGEHFRYTGDKEWLRRIQPAVLKSCQFILDWRKRNLKEELRGKGFGLIEGKVADPNDFFHSYMLNGLAYVGLKRIVEAYDEVDRAAVAHIKNELEPYLRDIRASYADNVARSPVIPIGNGSWIPSFSPWAEYAGPVSLHADGGRWFSHGMFACRDSLIGSLYLGIGEVLEPKEQLADWLLYAHQELMTLRNAGMSQPYYCRHDWLHLMRGEVKQFLKTYYNQFTSIQDRETYTFWEHYFGAHNNQHKTHEEGWFLMQTRWMLWHEDFDSQSLKLLSMIPRAWLEAGKQIKLEKCKSYFGAFSLHVKSSDPLGIVNATLEFHGQKPPKTVSIRIPHPTGETPRDVQGGKFNAQTETVDFQPTALKTTIIVRY